MSGVPAILLETTVNGALHEIEIEPRMMLIDLLRERLSLTGTKRSCDMQVCGSCTVLLDGQPVSSCCTLAYEAHGREVLTIEGVSGQAGLHPVQQAFLDEFGVQCGFCTPGMVLTAMALLDEDSDPDESKIRSYLSGNLCRCTGYFPILKAVQRASELLSQAEEAPS